MRTTVELTDSQRARLLQLAAERGEKGFSRLVQEAVDQFLAQNEAQRERARAAIAALGTLKEDEAASLGDAVRASRRSWR